MQKTMRLNSMEKLRNKEYAAFIQLAQYDPDGLQSTSLCLVLNGVNTNQPKLTTNKDYVSYV